MNKNWSHDELEAAVKSYIEMRQRDINGESFTKKRYYEDLSRRFGRTIKSYEYRMQNISYVYSLMGRNWIKGLRPAVNVGTKVASEIESIINKIENQTLSNVVVFQSEVNNFKKKLFNEKPEGNQKPRQYNIVLTQFIRDPKIVAWVLNEANGICECCNNLAPFMKEDNTPFLEVHHIRRLADGGSDSITNAVAVCPNCHRQLHYGKNKEVIINQIYSQILRLEKE